MAVLKIGETIGGGREWQMIGGETQEKKLPLELVPEEENLNRDWQIVGGSV